MKTHPRGALVVAALVALAACSSGSSSSDYTVVREGSSSGGATNDTTAGSGGSGSAVPVDEIEWRDCASGECGTLDVPYDYDDPSAGQFTLQLARYPASGDRIGSLVINPGGPGVAGIPYALSAEFIFTEAILEHFDIIGWDARGAGHSSPAVDCIDDFDEYFGLDVPPVDEAAHQALVDAGRSFAEQCEERSGEILPYVSTEASARDIDSIRRALGEDQISYFGFSYGSRLGATWVKLFPDTVRAAVLDGASDPTGGNVQLGIDQAKGFERQLDAFLADCSSDSSCPFHNDGAAEDAYDDLMIELRDHPIEVSPDRTPVTRGVATTAVIDALYLQSTWEGLAQALAEAQAGNGAGLLAGFDNYYQRFGDGTEDNTIDALHAVNCLDDAGPRTIEGVDADVPLYVEVAPRLGASLASGYICAQWPVASVGFVDVTGAGNGPVVVIGTTGDPATPIESTEAMADTLADGRLIVVSAEQHTGYGVNSCVDDAVDDYLIDLEPPDDGLQCK